MEILIALIALTIGAAAGFFAGRAWSVRHDKTAALSRQLDETHAEYSHYQDQVDQHFHKTADLVNNLTQTYSEIHQHLSEGAQRLSKRTLAKTSIEQNFLRNNASPQHPSSVSNPDNLVLTNNNPLEPPRDYAPKSSDEVGALAENYGINSPTKGHQ
jgi:hypothetical protein